MKKSVHLVGLLATLLSVCVSFCANAEGKCIQIPVGECHKFKNGGIHKGMDTTKHWHQHIINPNEEICADSVDEGDPFIRFKLIGKTEYWPTPTWGVLVESVCFKEY